ncbi:MAG: sensor histidine kinase N-terminal domain-containing protein [Gammaproteobacteria bacterium]|nr:sensor histidine kinase N-terminal domain-containing protein [Gammaproteobacteria bacterium]
MLNNSIKQQIIISVNLVIFIVLALASVMNYYRSLHEIDEVFDAQLAQTTRLLAKIVETDPSIALRESPLEVAIPDLSPSFFEVPSAMERLKEGHKYESQIGFQVRTASGKLLLKSENTSGESLAPLQAGYFELTDPLHHWISFSLYDPASQLWLQAGQRIEVRNELSLYLVTGQIGQMMMIMLLLSAIIYLLVHRAFRPLEHFCEQLHQTSPELLRPIAVAMPVEIQPVQHAINKLLGDINRYIEQEKRFIADASHELRTPLTVLRLHAQNIDLLADKMERRNAVDAVISSAIRMSHLVNQLMALARIDRQLSVTTSIVNIAEVIEYSFSLIPASQLERVHFIVDVPETLCLSGDRTLLQIVFRNLLDNATKYAPLESTVHVTAHKNAEHTVVSFENDVVQPLNSQWHRLSDRFYRSPEHQQIEGAGLGLSIVKQISLLHHATLRIAATTNGLQVAVVFPNVASDGLSLDVSRSDLAS